jgi:hypothetical protein
LNVVCNWLLRQAIARARALGPSRVWADPVMARWLWEPNDLDLQTYLANDDIRTGYHLQRWLESGPPDLADPCGRLLERRLLKATAVSHLTSARRLELLAEARRLAEAQGFCAEVSCGLQQRQSRGYHAYKGGLRLWDGERLEALEQRSKLVQSLAAPVEWAWLIHPAEVAPKLRQLISA